MLALTGLTDMEDRIAKVTVSVVLPETVPKVAVMVTGLMLGLRAVARPLLSMIATDVLDELQVTWSVISVLAPLLKAPVAVNCRVIPTGMLGLGGVTDMEYTGVAITVRVVVPIVGPVEKLLGMLEVAVIVVLPGAIVVTRPLPVIVATSGSDEVQVTCVVKSWFVWSL